MISTLNSIRLCENSIWHSIKKSTLYQKWKWENSQKDQQFEDFGESDNDGITNLTHPLVHIHLVSNIRRHNGMSKTHQSKHISNTGIRLHGPVIQITVFVSTLWTANKAIKERNRTEEERKITSTPHFK